MYIGVGVCLQQLFIRELSGRIGRRRLGMRNRKLDGVLRAGPEVRGVAKNALFRAEILIGLAMVGGHVVKIFRYLEVVLGE